MSNNVSEQITEMASQIMNAVTSLQQINNEAVQTLVNQQLSGFDGLVSTSKEQIAALKDVKTPEEAVEAQTKIAKEIGEAMLTQAKSNIDVLNKSREQMETLVQKEVNSFIEKAKSTTL